MLGSGLPTVLASKAGGSALPHSMYDDGALSEAFMIIMTANFGQDGISSESQFVVASILMVTLSSLITDLCHHQNDLIFGNSFKVELKRAISGPIGMPRSVQLQLLSIRVEKNHPNIGLLHMILSLCEFPILSYKTLKCLMRTTR